MCWRLSRELRRACGIVADPLTSIALAPYLPSRCIALIARDPVRMLTWAKRGEPQVTDGTSSMQLAFFLPTGRAGFEIACDPIGFTAEDSRATMAPSP